jgi:hypothetical protein
MQGGVPLIPMDAFIHRIDGVVVEVVVINIISDREKIKVDTILKVVENLVGVNGIVGGVVETNPRKGVEPYGIPGDGVIVVGAAVHPVLLVAQDDVVLNGIGRSDDHHPVIDVFTDAIVVFDDAPATVLRLEPRIIIAVELIMEDGRVIAVIIHIDTRMVVVGTIIAGNVVPVARLVQEDAICFVVLDIVTENGVST